MNDVCWKRFALLSANPHARSWLSIQADLQLAPNTLIAYGRALEDYLSFCARNCVDADNATREHLASFVRDLAHRPNPRGKTAPSANSKAGLANATLRQRLTAIRLYYDYLIEEGLRDTNPVGRGRYTANIGCGILQAELAPHCSAR